MVKAKRSTNFPVIDLEEAVQFTRKVWEYAERSPVPAAAVAEKLWGYSASSSSGRQRLAALRAFDLVEASGSGEGRRIRVTEDAAKIMLGHPDAPNIIKECALAPRVHRAIWDHFSEDGPPPDETIKHFLMLEFDPPFSQESAHRFIAQFRRTLAYAGLDRNGHKLPQAQTAVESSLVGGQDGTSDSASGRFENPRGADQPHRSSLGEPQGLRRQDVFSVDEGEIIISWPVDLSADSIEDIEGWLEIIKRKLRRASKARVTNSAQDDED